MKFIAVIYLGLEMRLYTLTAKNKEAAHRRVLQLTRVRAYMNMPIVQRPLFIHMIPIPEGDQVNQIYVSQF